MRSIRLWTLWRGAITGARIDEPRRARGLTSAYDVSRHVDWTPCVQPTVEERDRIAFVSEEVKRFDDKQGVPPTLARSRP